MTDLDRILIFGGITAIMLILGYIVGRLDDIDARARAGQEAKK